MDFSQKFSIIQKELKLTQKELASWFNLSQNTVSQYLGAKRSPDITTMQKLVNSGVSPIFLFSEVLNKPFDKKYNAFLEACIIAEKMDKDEELINLLIPFTYKYKLLFDIKQAIVKINGRNFFQRFLNLMNGDKERMFLLLYYFLEFLEDLNIDYSPSHLNLTFSTLLSQFQIPSFKDTKYVVEIRKDDLNNLVIWAKENLDTVSIVEIISSAKQIKDIVKNQMYLIDRMAVEYTELKK